MTTTNDEMNCETLETHFCQGGVQSFHRHVSVQTGTAMRFAVFTPPGPGPHPVVWFLAGLTCTEETFFTKSGAQATAATLGLMLIAPDTSPRGAGVPDEEAWDLGQGAGFYLDATQRPWAANFQMRSWLESELPRLVGARFAADLSRQGIMGHSMGGHGALTLALRNPGRFSAVSAFAPIASPMNCPWGQKAFTSYLGADQTKWRLYDACALLDDGARVAEILVDQGDTDPFLVDQLKPQLLAAACARAGVAIALRRQPGYDHSYWFIQSFIGDHLRWHASRLGLQDLPRLATWA